MTALQALRERVEQLSEDEAAEWFARIEWESTEMDTLTEEELADALAGRAEHLAGQSIDGEELFRQLGLER